MADVEDYRWGETHDEIARLAYELYERRGCQDGQAEEDWLAAEKALVHHYR